MSTWAKPPSLRTVDPPRSHERAALCLQTALRRRFSISALQQLPLESEVPVELAEGLLMHVQSVSSELSLGRPGRPASGVRNPGLQGPNRDAPRCPGDKPEPQAQGLFPPRALAPVPGEQRQWQGREHQILIKHCVRLCVCVCVCVP